VNRQCYGGGYVIVQQILVDVTGEPFPDLMQELVLQPLHMVHSTFQQPIPEKLRSLAATPYNKDRNAIEGGFHDQTDQSIHNSIRKYDPIDTNAEVEMKSSEQEFRSTSEWKEYRRKKAREYYRLHKSGKVK
jgi:CubicO group peptidase (beta-lactamase class C family)